MSGSIAAPLAVCGQPSAQWDSEDKYRVLFDSIDEGFCVIEVLFDAQGVAHDYRFIEVNPSFERQTGLHDAVGKLMRTLAPGHEEHWFRLYGEIARTGMPRRFEERAEALGRWYDVYAFRVGEPGQNLVAVLFNDITARKRLEKGLADSVDALREADRRKDRFLATLSHELRNPLAPLTIAAELLHSEKLTPQQLHKTREIITRQVGQMARLLDDLLDVARITQGKLMLRKRPSRIADVIDVAIESVRPLLDRKQHHLQVELPSPDLMLDVDPARISQVVANLLANAAKYTDAGGRISISARALDGTFVLEVQDNGIGIAPDELPKVFEMFAQQPDALGRSEGGLGIGLTLVRGIVELHGGSVEAASEGRGKGSRFTLRLPLGATTDAGPQHTRAPAAEGSHHKVLIADDNRDTADTLAMLLTGLGHEVRVVYDGREAIAVGRVFQPDVAVLDIGMPGMDGYAVANAFRNEPWAKGMLLVAATGWGDKEAKDKAAQAGFDRHLTKPVDVGHIQALLAA